MENYTKQSYEPDCLFISCSGGCGINNEPFSLVPCDDKLTQNILILAYDKPLTVTELAKSLGIPAPYIEPVVEKLVGSELMKKTDGGKVYTDFIIYKDADRKANFKEQLETAEKNFESFWSVVSEALAELRERDYYKRQNNHAKHKLEIHFSIKLLMNANVSVREEITGAMPYEDYPHRKDGGRWIAMGNLYPAGYKFEYNADIDKYTFSGEAGTAVRNFRDAKNVVMRIFSTELGKIPYRCYEDEYTKWLYEINSGIPFEESSVGTHILESADTFIECGILVRDNGLKIDIPILTEAEYRDESHLAYSYVDRLYKSTREAVLPLYMKGYTRLPVHLKSVPKYQQYMNCGYSVTMAVIYQAVERRLFLKDVNYPVPAAILVIDN